MSFENYLDQLQPATIPGMGGLEESLAQNQRIAPPPQQPRGGPNGLMHILGLIGATLASARGKPAPYMEHAMQERQRAQQQQANQAFANYLGDPELAALIMGGANPAAAMQAYGIKHPKDGAAPETIRLMQAAGIDPQSEEGRAIIRGNLTKGGGQSDPTFVRELEALGIDPGSDEARELYYGRNSPAGYLLKPRPRGAKPGGGAPTPGQVFNGFRYKGGNPNDKASWEPAGGASASPAPTFPR